MLIQNDSKQPCYCKTIQLKPQKIKLYNEKNRNGVDLRLSSNIIGVGES